MKKLIGILIMALMIGVLATGAYAVTTLNQSASVTLASVLSAEFANTTDSTFGGSTIPWTNVDPSSNLVRPTGYSTTKPDVGIICKYNGAATAWYLKMNFTSTTLSGKIKKYMSQPTIWNGTSSVATNGAVAGGADTWQAIPSTAATVYTSGANDKVNTPYGTFCGMNFALDPTGLATGTTYSGTITYTITTTP
ncbi:MAG: hypothetical protein HZA30_04865 [Candidatus Omnitrophica bacterium]|nr:hypothetical protein [Candidatus Omnitrophota bacterium]